MSSRYGADRARSHATDSAQDDATASMVVLASPPLLMSLQLMPVVGILGVLALYWSRSWRDALFLLGSLLVLGALGTFRVLRARLVERVEQQLIVQGLVASRARTRARRDVDRLLRLERPG